MCYMNEYVTSSCVSNNACVPDKTTMSTTKKEYLITPTFSGSITFSIDCYLGFNEGMKVNCWPSIVLSRGKIIVQDGELQGEKGYGKFLKSEISSYVY